MSLTENFTLDEMLKSQTAIRKGIAEQFNPPAHVVQALAKLCVNILEPLRAECGPIKVNSGYRSPKTNAAVGGAKTSQHLRGEAADIEGVNVSNATLFRKIQELKLPFDQLIWEFGTQQEPSWVHVSFSERNRRQVLYIPRHLEPK